MHRTQIYFEESLFEALKQEAKARVSLSLPSYGKFCVKISSAVKNSPKSEIFVSLAVCGPIETYRQKNSGKKRENDSLRHQYPHRAS